MDNLRVRRRTALPPASTTPTSPSKPLSLKPRRFPSLSILTNVFQFTIILVLVALSRRAPLQPLPSPPPSSPDEPPVPLDVHATIYAYDRPRHLLALLRDLLREADLSHTRLHVHVIDDNSYACVFPPSPNTTLISVPLLHPDALPCAARRRFAAVETLLAVRGWQLSVARYRHGRRRYWKLVRAAHEALRKVEASLYLFLPDDDRLAAGFFGGVKRAWEGVGDARKMTMMLHVEETREFVPVWTEVRPRNIGGGVWRIGWVESGNFVCEKGMLEFLNWSFPEVSPQRWVDNPSISSGVGAMLSEMLHRGGKRMYRMERSFVAHVGVSLSKMNAQFRKKGDKVLVTRHFEGGEERYEELLQEAATVTASIASQWMREAALHEAVESLSHQVDHLNVYLNGYDSVPAFLNVPYVTVLQSENKSGKGDIGDIGKFFWCNELDTEFHLTADDDIIYPPDYVSKLLLFWQKFEAPVVVGVHGIRIKQDDLSPSTGRGNGYYGSREVWMAVEDVPESVNVHIIGTGTMLYRKADIGAIDLDVVFQRPNMADVWFGLLAQSLRIPMVIIPHAAGWIKEVPGTFEDSIYKRSTRNRHADRHQTMAAKSIPEWVLYKPISTGR